MGRPVRRVLFRGEPLRRSSLSATRCRAALAAHPGTRRAASSSPVWPCSGRGLPCGPCHHDPGGLLHRRFTLTGTDPGGLFSVALSRGSLRVGVTHRPALRSPDVPRGGHPATRPSGRPIRGFQSSVPSPVTHHPGRGCSRIRGTSRSGPTGSDGWHSGPYRTAPCDNPRRSDRPTPPRQARAQRAVGTDREPARGWPR